MSKLSIHIENHEQKYTVSEMRRRLALILSKLKGDQEVTFSFHAVLEQYNPDQDTAVTIVNQTGLKDPTITTLSVATIRKCKELLEAAPQIEFSELARPEND